MNVKAFLPIPDDNEGERNHLQISYSLFAMVGMALVIGSLFYLADYVTKTSTMVLLVCLFVPLIVGVPMTNVIRGKLGLLKTQQLLITLAGVGLAAIAFVPVSLIPACLILAGFGLAGPQTLTNLFFAQVADEDELKSGVRREGAFFGINALVTKPAQSIAIALAPFVLSMTHFVTREANGGTMMANQPAAAVFGIKVFSGLIPGLAMFAGAAILAAFPIKGERLEKMGTELLALHEEKERKLSAEGSS